MSSSEHCHSNPIDSCMLEVKSTPELDYPDDFPLGHQFFPRSVKPRRSVKSMQPFQEILSG